MKRFERRGAGPCLVLLGLVILLVGCKKPAPAAGKTSVEISYPAEGAIFPPDIAWRTAITCSSHVSATL